MPLPLDQRLIFTVKKGKMADHPGAPPGGGGGGGGPIVAGPPGDPSSSTMVIMPPSPAAIRLFGEVRKGLEKSATGKFVLCCVCADRPS